MNRGRSILSAVAVALAAIVVLAGCAEPPRPQPSATALPGGIQASLVQLRSDVAERQAQVRIHNTDDEPLTVGTVRVDDPRFLGHAVRSIRRQTTIAPGATVDIRVQLPPMDCTYDADGTLTPTPAPSESSPQSELTPAATPEPDPSATPGEGGATPTPEATGSSGGLPPATSTRATLGYRLGASIATAVSALSEPIPFLTAMYERECLGQKLADDAAVGLGAFTPSAAGQPADLALEVGPTGVGAATIVGIHETNLLSYGDGAATTDGVYPIGLAVGPGSAAQTVHLPLVPARCDAHVLMEDKKGTVFSVDVVVDGQSGTVQLAASDEQRGEILSWVSQWCGNG